MRLVDESHFVQGSSFGDLASSELALGESVVIVHPPAEGSSSPVGTGAGADSLNGDGKGGEKEVVNEVDEKVSYSFGQRV